MQSKPKRSLDDRIAAAFTVDTTSADVAELIGQAECAASAAGEVAQLARTQALDPALSAERVAKARRDMDEAAFRRDRMQMAVTKLGERLTELRAQEEEQRRWQVYDKVRVERDKLVDELKEMYPVFATRLADLTARIDANDREIETINTRARPEGSEWLAGAEVVARNIEGFNVNTANIPRITRDLRLPAFEYNQLDPYVWPRP